jgi:membrane-associated phospholipid phosphatase
MMGTTAWAIAIALALQSAPPQAPAAPAAGRDVNPLTHIFQNLVKDAAALPSKTSLAILLAGSAGAGAAYTVDHDLADWAARTGPSSYTKTGDVLGLGAVQGAAAVAAYAIGRAAHRPAVVHVGSDLIRAQFLNGVVTTGLKFAVDRTRPNGGRRSFPSGHTSASFASAVVLGKHLGWKAAVPAYAAAGFIGWTRLRDHVHYPSDAVAGATLGLIVGRTITAGHRQRAWTVVPVRTPGGVAVYVVRAK